MSLKTFDDRDVSFDVTISNDFHTESGSGTTTKNHTYTVSGNGFVVVTASIQCTGSTSDYGTSRVDISLNGVSVAHGYNRITTANTEGQGGAASATVQVMDGDIINIQAYQSKAGAKTFRYYCLAIGCTVTYV